MWGFIVITFSCIASLISMIPVLCQNKQIVTKLDNLKRPTGTFDFILHFFLTNRLKLDYRSQTLDLILNWLGVNQTRIS